jgi:acyl carrier protein
MTGPTGDGAGVPPPTIRRVSLRLTTSYAPPRTELERQLADLWSRHLGVQPVGVDDDFFELGGHSLAAAELLVDVAALTGVEVSASTLFLEPSVADLAAAIEAASAGTAGDR